MGCAQSTPVKEDVAPYKDNLDKKLPAAVEEACAQVRSHASIPQLQTLQQQNTARRGVSFAGDVHDTPTRSNKAGNPALCNEASSDVESPSRAASISGRPRCV